jgi:hypothetical protein
LNTANANTTGRNGDPGKGDGNSIMEGCAVNATALGCETAYFWVDLAAASLIPQRLNTYTGSVTTVNSAAAAAIPNYIPRTRLRDSTYLHVFPHNSRNYFYVGGITDTSAAGAPTLDKGLSNGEARSLDEKFDDGLPLVGIVTAITALSGTLETAATAADGVCVTTTPANTYNLNDDYINSVSCRLMMRTSF